MEQVGGLVRLGVEGVKAVKAARPWSIKPRTFRLGVENTTLSCTQFSLKVRAALARGYVVS